MCGFCGIVGRPDSALCARMLDSIRHRGPDSFNVTASDRAAFGGCRLAIVGERSAAMPFEDRATGSLVLFNGEIYNYRELCAQLGLDPSGHPDPESLLIARLLARDGPCGVAQLKGMFALAVLRDGAVVLARDRLGIKPLFYARPDGTLVFGSEAKAILQHPSVAAAVDQGALDEIAVFGYMSSPGRTPFVGIHQVRPGCAMVWHENGEREVCYWQPQAAHENGPTDVEAAGADLLGVLRRSVRSLLSHDRHRKGFFLSGGVDSSLLVALAAEVSDSPVLTFTLADSPDAADLLAARRVAAAIGADHQEYIVGLEEYLAELPTFVRHYESLIAGGVFDIHGGIAFQILSRTISEQVRVACSGEGADELFGGYYWTYTHPLGFADRMRERLARIGSPPGVAAQVDALFPQPEDAGVYRRHLFDFLIRGGLANYHLWSVDRSGGAFGFEIRPPYLHDDIVEHALSLPVTLKASREETKRVLKAAARPIFERLGVEDCLSRLKEGMPAAVRATAGRLDSLLLDLIPDSHLASHPYRRHVRSRLDCLMFDLFAYVFLANRGNIPSGFEIATFYRDGTCADLYR